MVRLFEMRARLACDSASGSSCAAASHSHISRSPTSAGNGLLSGDLRLRLLQCTRHGPRVSAGCRGLGGPTLQGSVWDMAARPTCLRHCARCWMGIGDLRWPCRCQPSAELFRVGSRGLAVVVHADGSAGDPEGGGVMSGCTSAGLPCGSVHSRAKAVH